MIAPCPEGTRRRSRLKHFALVGAVAGLALSAGLSNFGGGGAPPSSTSALVGPPRRPQRWAICTWAAARTSEWQLWATSRSR